MGKQKHRALIKPYYFINTSLYIQQCGFEECQANYSFGPVVRDHYLFHFVFEGKGEFFSGNDKRYSLHRGQAFLSIPGEKTSYRADSIDPWKYGWLGFNGFDAMRVINVLGISQSNPIISIKSIEKLRDCVERLIRNYDKSGNSFLTTSNMFEAFSFLKYNKDISINSDSVLNTAIDYIMQNITHQITVAEIAELTAFSSPQIYRLFQKKTGMSPKQYILRLRINNAASLLATTSMNINEIASQCGYKEANNLIRQFKQIHGCPPTTYRKRLNVEDIIGDV